MARLIKKYPNRRLYDTCSSAYITLAEVKHLVLERAEFQVVDAKTSQDLTRCILMQIILEEEMGGAPLFSCDMLSQMIRSYGNAMQDVIGRYLEQGMRSLIEMQQKAQEQPGPERVLTLQGLMGQYLQQRNQLFLEMQQQMQQQARALFEALPYLATGTPDSTIHDNRFGTGREAGATR